LFRTYTSARKTLLRGKQPLKFEADLFFLNCKGEQNIDQQKNLSSTLFVDNMVVIAWLRVIFEGLIKN